MVGCVAYLSGAAMERALERVGDLRAVVVHGDLQRKNLLAAGGRLTGVRDWKGKRSAGALGLDLLYLAVTSRPASAQASAVRSIAAGGDAEGTALRRWLSDAGVPANLIGDLLVEEMDV